LSPYSIQQDLLFQVDSRMETPDSISLYAPPAASSAPVQATPPYKVHSKNPWASAMQHPIATQRSSTPLDRVMEHSPRSSTVISPDATITASERYSFAYDNDRYLMNTAPSQQHTGSTKSPMSPPPGPINRGWDDIKRFSADKVVPRPSTLSPPLGYWSPPPTKKQSLPQLRRMEAQLFGSPEATRSIDRLPLRAKSPYTHHKSSSFDHTRSRTDSTVRSPDTTFHHGLQIYTPTIPKKKSGNMEFARSRV
jgi:hypothetical protein